MLSLVLGNHVTKVSTYFVSHLYQSTVAASVLYVGYGSIQATYDAQA